MTCLTFFPYLVAGPVVRPKEFLSQLDEPRRPPVYEADLAFALIVVGLFKKIVIANSLQQGLVEPVLAAPFSYSRGLVLAATYGYAMQIYSDFSAYSDLAIGVALLLGFRTPDNFASPYRAQSLQEFWRRWHITLSTWLRDYLYIPLGGSRKGAWRTAANLFVTMLLGGLWHGARGTFVCWGAWHGLALVVERQWLLPRRKTEPHPAVRAVRTVMTFHFVCLGWVLFRAESLADAWDHLRALMLPRTVAVEPFVLPGLLWLLLAGSLAVQFLPPGLLQPVRERIRLWPAAAQGLLLGIILVLLRAAWPDGVAPFIYAGF
jgi:D-alanyl-lipoteichoic acid acyltransferase DltB (MBOAT superfamily)